MFLLIIYFLLNLNLSFEYPQAVQIINSCPTAAIKTNSSRSIRSIKQNLLPILRNSHESDESDESDEDQSTDLKTQEVTLTVPSTLVNGTILNETLFITDGNQNDLNLTQARLCANDSNFNIKYSTNQPLPHTVCLYLHLTNSQLYICQILQSSSTSGDGNDDDDDDDDQEYSPSALFIVSQAVIICLFMLLICAVHTSKQKRIVYRVRRRFLQANDSNLSPMQEEILSAGDLTSISTDRKFTKTNSIILDELTRKLTH